jgi:hypothetical protein
MEAASPDLEKQGFFAVVFVNREYSGQPDLVALQMLFYIQMFCNEVTPKSKHLFISELLVQKNLAIFAYKNIQ